MKKLITIYLLNLMSLALCTSTIADQSDARKTSVRSPASTITSAHLNSLQTSQDSINKQQSGQSQSQLQSSSGGTSYRIPGAEYSSQPNSNSIYSQPTAPTGGYFISVNPQSIPAGALGAGPTPVIMQYLPHNAQQGPIQYLQLIPTRPLIVPISPYLPSFNNPYAQPSTLSGPSAQASASSPYTLSHHSYAPQSNSHSYGSSYQPSSLQNPMGGYSTNYLTYFRPNNGMQIVNGPIDLSLNTNEYLPLQNENSYKMRRT